jgi:hypothetical protein
MADAAPRVAESLSVTAGRAAEASATKTIDAKDD